MRLFALLLVNCHVARADRDGCEWLTGATGDFLECEPDFYIRGACESGTENHGSGRDCQVNGLIGHQAFGIHCCPIRDGFDFGNTRECKWFGGASGDYVSCVDGQAAFGRCQTSSKNHSGGDCNNMSHQVKCCESDATVNVEKCGWLYADYGIQVNCPKELVVTGFCGVNSHEDCPNGTFLGIRCCPPQQ